ncbi:MAG TPA: hypothetical protein PK957_00775 [Candidatus Dojkabacteria bacterium]|nr:hypothetical protein [Candidatus Dojkabacteria bacterium]
MALEQGSTGVNSGVSGTGPTRLPDAVADVAQAPVAEFPEVPSVTRVPAEEIGAEANGTEAQATPGPDVVAATSGTLESGDFSTQGATDAEAGDSTTQGAPHAKEDGTEGVECEKDEKRRFTGFGKVIAVAGIVFSLAKGILKGFKGKEAVAPQEKEAVEEIEADRIFQKFSQRVQGTLDKYADIARDKRKGVFAKWLGRIGEQHRASVAEDNAYRESHKMKPISSAQRIERMLALVTLALVTVGVDVITPDLTGLGVTDVVVDKFIIDARKRLYEEWTGDQMEPVAMQIAELALNFVPGARMFNLMLGPLWEIMIQKPGGAKLQRFEEYVDNSAAMAMVKSFLEEALKKANAKQESANKAKVPPSNVSGKNL